MSVRKSQLSTVVLSLELVMMVSLLFSMPACHTGTSLSTDNVATHGGKHSNNPYANAEIVTKIIPSANNTFGYDILLYGKPFIHQPNLPGLPGNEGFSTQEKAQTVAEFVMEKIRNNEMPPTVRMEDLNSMGVLK